MGGYPQFFVASQFFDGGCCEPWACALRFSSGISTSGRQSFSISYLFYFCCNRISYSFDHFHCVALLFGVFRMVRIHFVLRHPQILSPHCRFIFTGTGIAAEIRQCILEFLYCTGDFSIQCFCNCSTAVFCATINWTQVDTPSVASQGQIDDDT